MRKFTVILAVTVALLMAIPFSVSYWFQYGLWALAIYAAMILALPFSSLLHELGHMLFGAVCKIKAVPEFKLFGSSNCKLIPKTDKHLRVRVYFTAAGGLIVNAVLFIVGYILLIVSSYEISWITFFMPATAYLYIMNEMPVQFASGKTDGYICNAMLNNTDDGKVMIAVLKAQAQILNGKPVQDLDENLLFDLPQIQEDDPAFISLTELRYEYLSAKGETERAEIYRQRFEQLKEEYL